MVDYRSKVNIGVIVLVVVAVISAAAYFFWQKPAGKTAAATGNDPAVYELVWTGSEYEHQAIQDFTTYMAESDQPILVDFWAEWCGPCRQAAPTIESLAKTYSGKVHVVKINTDNAGDIAQKFGVSGIPNFVVIKNSKVVSSVTGYWDGLEDDLSGKLDEALA